MSRLADQDLNDLNAEDDCQAVQALAHLAGQEPREPEYKFYGNVVHGANDALKQATTAWCNTLGLVASDLIAAGWDSDASGTLWTHPDHATCTFLAACKIEANKVAPECDVEDF